MQQMEKIFALRMNYVALVRSKRSSVIREGESGAREANVWQILFCFRKYSRKVVEFPFMQARVKLSYADTKDHWNI